MVTHRMTDSTYKGDSPNKKMVRALAWLFGVDLLNQMGVRPKGAYVLAGHGGDVRTLWGAIDILLKQPGARWSELDDFNITAVDFDEKLIEGLKDNVMKDAPSIDADDERRISRLTKYLTGMSGRADRLVESANDFNMSHMDFCNAVSVDNIYTVKEVIKASSGISYNLVTVMRGREPGPASHDILVPRVCRGERRRRMKVFQKRYKHNSSGQAIGMPTVGAQILKSGTLDVKKSLKEVEDNLRVWVHQAGNGKEFEAMYFKKNGDLTPYSTAVVRATLFVELLQTSLGKSHILGTVYHDAYHSNSENSRGTPFVTFGILSIPVDDVDNYDQSMMLMSNILHDVKGMALSGFKRSFYHGAKGSFDDLRNNAILTSMYAGVHTASDLLSIPSGTLTAWKAHAARGTYGEYLERMSKKYSLPFGHKDRPQFSWSLESCNAPK